MANSAGNNGDDDLQSDKVRENFDKRLSDLDKKISQAKDSNEEDTKPRNVGRSYSYAFRIASELITAPVVATFIGWWIDRALGTTPIFLLILLVLGLAAGIRSVIGTAEEMQKKENSRDSDTEI